MVALPWASVTAVSGGGGTAGGASTGGGRRRPAGAGVGGVGAVGVRRRTSTVKGGAAWPSSVTVSSIEPAAIDGSRIGGFQVASVLPMAGCTKAVSVAGEGSEFWVEMPVHAKSALPSSVPHALDPLRGGGEVRVTVNGGHPYKLRAEGGYITRAASGAVVRPLGPGQVTVHATVVDELARVTDAWATTRAQ